MPPRQGSDGGWGEERRDINWGSENKTLKITSTDLMSIKRDSLEETSVIDTCSPAMKRSYR